MADTMTPKVSSQYTDYLAGNKVAGYDWGGKVRRSYFSITVTAAGFSTAAAGDIPLVLLPAGFIRVLTPDCHIYCPAGSSTADLDVGWADYVDNTGTTVTGDLDGFLASADVGGAAIDSAFLLPAVNRIKEFNSKNGVIVAASIDTANGPASGVINGWVSYMHVG